MTPLAAAGPLIEAHDAVLLDLDGVVQLGDQPVQYAAEALAELHAKSVRRLFVTNNASRSAAEVAEQLHRLGVPAAADEVVTSAMVAADVLAARFPAGSAILVVGGAGLVDAVGSAGLRPVREARDDVVAVVQGWAPEVNWSQLAEASVALRAGATWIATNDDRTLPSPRGPLPGNGSMVAALATATSMRPEVVGKPHPPLFSTAAGRLKAKTPLFVGDRLDTDVAGAVAADVPSLLVLTGVATARDLLAADSSCRPTYVGADLRALLTPHRQPAIDGDVAHCGDASVTSEGSVTGGDPLDILRAACALAWSGALAESRYDAVLAAAGLNR